MSLDSEVGEEGGDLVAAHIFGVAFVVKEDEAPGPFQIDLFGANRIVLGAERFFHLVEQLLGSGRGCHYGSPCLLPALPLGWGALYLVAEMGCLCLIRIR